MALKRRDRQSLTLTNLIEASLDTDALKVGSNAKGNAGVGRFYLEYTPFEPT